MPTSSRSTRTGAIALFTLALALVGLAPAGAVDVDARNVPAGETRQPAAGVAPAAAEAPQAGPTDTYTFPAAGDPRFTLQTNFWNAGDYVEGTRSLTEPAIAVRMVLEIEENVLSCDTQDHYFMIDGTTVGTFSVEAGDTQVVADFFFPDIPAGNHTFRIETSTTVASGCGSAGFPEDVSTLTFYRRSTLVDVPALGGAGLAALALVLAGVSLWLLRRRRAA